MIPLDQARETVLARCQPLPPAAVPLDRALGCVLGAPVVSGEAVPPFSNTAMDGFALRAADTAGAGPGRPVPLRVTGTLAAGGVSSARLGPGEALQIMTGAPMPEGADAVVMVELTERRGDTVLVSAEVRPGNHVRPAGEDIAAGQEVFAAGTALSPGHLGVLASIGVLEVQVVGRPRVGVLSTGDEVVTGPEALRPGQIRDANRHTLLALLHRADCTPVDLGVVDDDPGRIEAAMASATERCDALITSGGVSMGEYDHVKAVLDRMGDMAWLQIAIRPAKPLAVGTIGTMPVFGLPGNPVSSMVSFELFARPGLRQMMGRAPGDLDRPVVEAVVDDASLGRQPDGKIHFARVTCRWDGGRYHVRSSGGQASHLLRAMALADALAVLADGPGPARGDTVPVMLLDP